MATLGVNVDHIATIRQARGGVEPDPVQAAVLAELAGCHGITAHLREDRRHIQDRDIFILKQAVSTGLNLEMAVSQEIILIALDVCPRMITLVPEKREERTTEGGLVVAGKESELAKITSETKEKELSLLDLSKDLEKQIENRLLYAYKRIRNNARNGLGVVTIQRDACGGCYNKIPPQRQLEIRSRKKIIVCEHCGRILIDEDMAEEVRQDIKTRIHFENI